MQSFSNRHLPSTSLFAFLVPTQSPVSPSPNSTPPRELPQQLNDRICSLLLFLSGQKHFGRVLSQRSPEVWQFTLLIFRFGRAWTYRISQRQRSCSAIWEGLCAKASLLQQWKKRNLFPHLRHTLLCRKADLTVVVPFLLWTRERIRPIFLHHWRIAAFSWRQIGETKREHLLLQR